MNHALEATLHGALDTIALAALAEEPAERYPSVADLAEDVRRYLRGESPSAPAVGARAPDEDGRFGRRAVRLAWLLAAVLVAVALAGLWTRG
jgi:serine/threonine-protein kinase